MQNIGTRSMLSTINSALPLIQTLVLMCLGLGYTAAMLRLVRRQYARRLAEGREDLVLAALARRGFSYRTARAALACAAQGAQPGEP